MLVQFPIAELSNGALIRREGWRHKKMILLADVRKVVAISRDALTHEEIMVGVFDASGREVWLSEFDKNFPDVMRAMSGFFPGFVGVQDMVSQKPFGRIERVLWEHS